MREIRPNHNMEPPKFEKKTGISILIVSLNIYPKHWAHPLRETYTSIQREA